MEVEQRRRFIEIFTGLDRAYGQTESRSKNENGKLEAKSWIEKQQLTEQKWYDHLDGKEPSLGIIPIKDDNRTVVWGDDKRQKVVVVPFGENVYSALGMFFKTDEGLDVLQKITNKL